MIGWYEVSKFILQCYTCIFIKSIRVVGRENLIPGPKIIAANHANFTDCFVLPCITLEKLHFLIQSNTFNLPILHTLLSKTGQIPVERGRGSTALKTAQDLLAEGKTVVIFPEGKFNHGEGLHRGRSGAAVLAMKSGAPITPVGFYVPPENTKTLKRRVIEKVVKANWQIRGRCYVFIGKPFRVPPTQDKDLNTADIRKLTNFIMTRIEILIKNAKEEDKNSNLQTLNYLKNNLESLD